MFNFFCSPSHFVGYRSGSSPGSQTSKLRGTSARSLFQWLSVPEAEFFRVRASSQRSQLSHVRSWSVVSAKVQRWFHQSRGDARGITLCSCSRSAKILGQTERQIAQQYLAQRQSFFQTRQSHFECRRTYSSKYTLLQKMYKDKYNKIIFYL